VASLLFAFVLLMILSFVGRPRERVARPPTETFIGVAK
jgi:hypothetical protein